MKLVRVIFAQYIGSHCLCRPVVVKLVGVIVVRYRFTLLSRPVVVKLVGVISVLYRFTLPVKTCSSEVS